MPFSPGASSVLTARKLGQLAAAFCRRIEVRTAGGDKLGKIDEILPTATAATTGLEGGLAKAQQGAE